MARDVRSLSPHSRLAWGLGCVALGCYPISMALGWLPVDEADVMAPMWVVAMAGLAFVIAGAMILLANHSWANDLLAGVLCLLFGITGTWVSLFSSSEGFSGGSPLLSDESNVMLGRWLFGIGALMCFAISAYAFRRAAQSSR
ncbi:MAG: hypothetical protein KJO09_01625 [Gammaproteobacteria bacterium]|nr:hypothetical protein [Gammaproteobacteria bacterium]